MEENGKDTAYMLVLSDITSEKEKENELVIAERMLESALSYIDGGFLEWDILSNKLYVSLIEIFKILKLSMLKNIKICMLLRTFLTVYLR